MEAKTLASHPQPPMKMIVVVVVMCAIFQEHFSEASLTSSIVLPLRGNIDTRWAYFTTMNIGKPSKPFNVHVDTASDVSWVPCDGPCENCNLPRNSLYKPPEGSIVECQDPLCDALQGYKNCENRTDRCEYVIQFADGSKTHGYLVRDNIRIKLTNGSAIHPMLVFGCGYKQIGEFGGEGILGLSRGSVGFLSQLNSQGLIKHVVGHCLRSGEGGGFLFLGDDIVPSSGVSWTPFTNNYHEEWDYLSGPVDLLFDGRPTQVTGLTLDFDSGSALSFLDQPAYQHTLHLINQALLEKPLIPAEPQSEELSICWIKDNHQPITSLNDVKKYFKKLTLKFTNEPDVKLDLPPQTYLILIEGKVCLGISDGDKIGLQHKNLIGAVLMQDKLVIYDNFNHRIGWISRNCDMDSMT